MGAPSPAMVVALIALVLGLVGTGYAAGKLGKNSVGTKQLKKDAVTSKKVKDGSLRASDFDPADLPQGETGPRGPQGVRGPEGARGPAGPAGRSALAPLQAGETIRGGFATEFRPTTAGDFYVGTAISYPVALAEPPTHSYVDGRSTGETCEGSSWEPTAPPDTLCLYPSDINNVEAIGFVDLGVPRISQGLFLQSESAGDSWAYGSWAFTEGG